MIRSYAFKIKNECHADIMLVQKKILNRSSSVQSTGSKNFVTNRVMDDTKKDHSILLPITILNHIMGCSGVSEYPLRNCHGFFGIIFSIICLLTFLLLICESPIFVTICFSINIFHIFGTIILGWNQRKVRFCLDLFYFYNN